MGLHGSGAGCGMGQGWGTSARWPRVQGQMLEVQEQLLGGAAPAVGGAAPRAQGYRVQCWWAQWAVGHRANWETGLCLKCQAGRGTECSATRLGELGVGVPAKKAQWAAMPGQGLLGAVPAGTVGCVCSTSQAGALGTPSAAQEGRHKQRIDSSNGDNP